MTRSLRTIAIAFLSLGLVVLAACQRGAEAPPAPDEGPQTPQAAAEPPTTLLALQGRRLIRADLASGSTEVLGRLPSREVSAAPDGSLVAFTELVEDPEEGEPNNPTLYAAAPEELDNRTEIGRGSSPLVSPDGTQVAVREEAEGYYLCPQAAQEGEDAPEDAEEAQQAGCFLGERVSFFPTDGSSPDEATHALGANVWDIFGWTEDHIVAGSTMNQNVWVGFAGAAHEEQLQVAFVGPDQVYAVNPAAQEILVSQEGSYGIRPIDEPEAPARLELALDAGDEVIGASWSPDGSLLFANLTSTRQTDIAFIDAASGEISFIDDAQGASHEAVWTPDGGHLASVIPAGTESFETVVCSVDSECSRPVEWDGPVRLLALY